MARQLSLREKVLLYIMSVLLLVVGLGLGLIYPAYERSSALGDTLSERQMRADMVKQDIASEPTILTQLGEYQEELDMLAGQFLKPYTNDQLDTYVTGLIKKHGMSVDALAIEEAAPLEIPADKNNENAQSGGEENLPAQTDSADTKEADPYAGVRDYIRTYQVRVVIRGELADFTALADEVQNLPGIRIFDFSITPAASAYTLDPQAADTSKQSINIGFELQLYDENALTSPVQEDQS